MSVEKRKLVHEFDLLNVLEGLGLKQRWSSGKMRCDWCKTPITSLDEISLLKREEGMIKICCSRLECIYKSQRPAING